MSRCTDPIHCLLPPNVLDQIARNGNDDQRSWALETLARDQTLRLARLQNAKVRARGPREGADALAVSASPRPNRIISDAAGTESVDGKVVRSEGDEATDDVAVNEAYDGLGDTFKFFFEAYSRNSIDGKGMPLRGVVHYGHRYANAFWDGRRMVFGDGDGEMFTRLTLSLDVIGHELGHGVTEEEADLEYLAQSGALNESMSDVFGSLVKQYKLQQTADVADWLIGGDVFTPGFEGDALRSMKAPGTAYDDPVIGKDPQPGHMRDYDNTLADNRGVHINSGIPNKAFYTVATELGGKAWEKAGRIWYDSLRHSAVISTTQFQGFADVTMIVAERLYGKGSAESEAVRGGWDNVGITCSAPPC